MEVRKCWKCDTVLNSDDTACSLCGEQVKNIATCTICNEIFSKNDVINGGSVCKKCIDLQNADSLMITSGFNFDGFRVKKYIGVLCSESAMGTGVINQFFADMSSFFEVESESFRRKMMQARTAATNRMKIAAYEQGANAIIGFGYDYETIGNSLFTVIAHGTAVVVEKE